LAVGGLGEGAEELTALPILLHFGVKTREILGYAYALL